MGETTSDRNAGAEHRRPYWAIGLGLLGFGVVVLAAAFLLNRQLEPKAGVAPLSTANTPQPSPTSTGNKKQASQPTPQPTDAVNISPPTSPPAPSPTPTVRQQVEQAYHRYWQEYSQALYTLDTSHMSAVATGTERQRVQAEVAALLQRNRAVHVRVTHGALVVSLKGDRATLYDEQHDRSFLINPVTKEPHNASVQPFREKDIYFMQKIHGTWKVVKSLRQR